MGDKTKMSGIVIANVSESIQTYEAEWIAASASPPRKEGGVQKRPSPLPSPIGRGCHFRLKNNMLYNSYCHTR